MIRPLHHDRSYIARLHRDPRTKAMLDGWIAQATFEADKRFPRPEDDRQRTCFAAETAVRLAMEFVLGNDGEYQAILLENDRLMQQVIDIANRTPPRLHVTVGPAPVAHATEKPSHSD